MNKSRRKRWVEYVELMGEMKNAYKTFVCKSEGKRQPRRPRHKWEDNTDLDIKKKCGRAWTEFVWLRIEAGGGLWRTSGFY
jgi:hypothetical protein